MASWTFEIDGKSYQAPYDTDFSTLSKEEAREAITLANGEGVPLVCAHLFVKARQEVPALQGMWTQFLAMVGPMFKGDTSIIEVERHGG